ncbi:MAG: hypothetical protein A3C43_07330 [Candidatus Schekmanbacteria bacterium RIFCSPHIGHO2_02_FULL_38_11]|uniref:Uncharacterized protein n=1 Tax=Candidatus Schekmanbacteria bacterium RIFCSPLOWO2_12_FULL_38_15 TaxID=1817883 RepID=A0A1F7SMR7_9BACT|nr:MAG: hypothetical protein A2043_07055 [Candidatus Schekmanbacteria bacterium GWA2_38_9]OGL47987.1 MAG: hypothetical protein A3H37_08155 [Candidatus Schekmanbacteria bacterium RIFCSPLOWO2_02_FULL_38_14]OGL48425.1 MAG: hypothetical protein A3C43_07330 [Candidatus Schekmanbacteria bacterium RIFCSPHIGHO2_02_FULL_38_11]OGL54528.1 MAG: hypothetical protein A3G31_10235 [Candidatus Schekmanbacteria bacterium RIFCSPLOWO2_12_FULL_38_15]
MKRLVLRLTAILLVSFFAYLVPDFARGEGDISVAGKLLCSSMEKGHKHTLKDSSGKVLNIIEKKPYEIGCQTEEVKITGNKEKENEIALKSFEVKQKDGAFKKYIYCEAHKKMDNCSVSEKK